MNTARDMTINPIPNLKIDKVFFPVICWFIPGDRQTVGTGKIGDTGLCSPDQC